MNIDDLSKESIENYYQRKYGKNLTKKEYFEIPKNITLDEDGDILFNDCEQVLHIPEGREAYRVGVGEFGRYIAHTSYFVLVPCERKDLRTGDTAHRTDYKIPDFDEETSYCKIINEEEYVYVSRDSCCVTNPGITIWKYWFKVVPREDVE